MKKILFTLLAIWTFSTSYATIRRVNNNSGILAVNGLVYTTLQAAITDAVSNDTLYIEPSSTNYTITTPITKKLHFIGNGYRINENQSLVSPLPFEVKNSRISGSFSINAGSEGSTFRSIAFFNGSISTNADELLFSRCTFEASSNLVLLSTNNILEQCFAFVQASVSQAGSGNIFRNCIWAGNISSQTNGLFDQCYIGSLSSLTNSVFTNSIIKTYSNMGATNSFSFCIKLIDGNNTTFPTPAINSNIENIATSSVFIESSSISNFDTFDKSFRYTNTSTALNNGSSGQPIGPFGGSKPYVLSGQPPVPIIRNFFLETTGSTASGLTGSITIQSNN